MKINLLRCVKQWRGNFYMGRRFAGRIHIGSSNRTLIRELRAKIVNREQRIGPQFKAARVALYAGGMLCHRRERELCRLFRL